MPNVSVTNTAVTEIVPTGGTFTPATGVEMVVNIQAGVSGDVFLKQGGNSPTGASGNTQNVTSEITVLLDDSMTVEASSQPGVVTGFVIDS